MTLTFSEFKNLISMYKNNTLTEETLIFENCIVPIGAVIQAAAISEDSIEGDEKHYLIKSIYDKLVDPHPISPEEEFFNDAFNYSVPNEDDEEWTKKVADWYNFQSTHQQSFPKIKIIYHISLPQ